MSRCFENSNSTLSTNLYSHVHVIPGAECTLTGTSYWRGEITGTDQLRYVKRNVSGPPSLRVSWITTIAVRLGYVSEEARYDNKLRIRDRELNMATRNIQVSSETWRFESYMLKAN